MLNEGIIVNETNTLMKSEMIKQLHILGTTDPENWERAVFESLTGGSREDVDWDIEDNKAGYYTWVKAFDGLIGELTEDGYVSKERVGDGWQLKPVETNDPLSFSHLVYPSRP